MISTDDGDWDNPPEHKESKQPGKDDGHGKYPGPDGLHGQDLGRGSAQEPDTRMPPGSNPAANYVDGADSAAGKPDAYKPDKGRGSLDQTQPAPIRITPGDPKPSADPPTALSVALAALSAEKPLADTGAGAEVPQEADSLPEVPEEQEEPGEQKELPGDQSELPSHAGRGADRTPEAAANQILVSEAVRYLNLAEACLSFITGAWSADAGEDPPSAEEIEEAEQQRFQHEVLAAELDSWGRRTDKMPPGMVAWFIASADAGAGAAAESEKRFRERSFWSWNRIKASWKNWWFAPALIAKAHLREYSLSGSVGVPGIGSVTGTTTFEVLPKDREATEPPQ
jgi:hypothetical protein